MSGSKPQLIHKGHIEKGLVRYGGVERKDLQKLLNAHDLHYTVKQFNDGRILLIYETQEYAFLIQSEQEIYSFIER